MTEHTAPATPCRRFAVLDGLVTAFVCTGAAPALAQQWLAQPIRSKQAFRAGIHSPGFEERLAPCSSSERCTCARIASARGCCGTRS